MIKVQVVPGFGCLILLIGFWLGGGRFRVSKASSPLPLVGIVVNFG